MSGALPGGDITRRMIGFARHLRENDFGIGPGETLAALALLQRQGIRDPAETRRSLRVLLTSRRDEWERFDDLFEAWWFARGRTRTRLAERPATKRRPAGPPRIWQDHLGDGATPAAPGTGPAEAPGEDEGAPGDGRGRLVASRQETLRRTDLRHIAEPEAMAEAERIAYRLARALRFRLSRRYRIAWRQSERLDLRRTIRANLSTGGDPVLLATRTRPKRPVRLVVLLDVSGSMQPYARIFLQFVKGLLASWAHADAFLFHTRLVRVSDTLRESDGIKAMTRLALTAEGFGGGTRLAPCLRLFDDRYAKAALNSRSVFIVMSDGYDTAPPEELAAQLARLKRRVRRLIWLNPLLGRVSYAPVNRAMAAAMPFIDHFAAAHSLDALAALEPELAAL